MKCEICGMELRTPRSVSCHLYQKHPEISTKAYYDTYVKSGSEGECKVCGRPTKFISLGDGYRSYCSSRCINRDPATRQKIEYTLEQKSGFKCNFQDPVVKAKIKQTNLDKYGVDNPAKSKAVQAKAKSTTRARYGVDCSLLNPEVKAKIKATMVQKFGVEHALQNPDLMQKAKASNLEKFGVEYSLQNPEIKAKSVKTCIEKFGAACALCNPDIIQKSRDTCVEKFGAAFAMQSPDFKQTFSQAIFDKYGVDNVSKLPEVIDKRRGIYAEDYTRRLSEFNCEFIALEPFAEIKFKCHTCGKTHVLPRNFCFTTRTSQGLSPCVSCVPKHPQVSKPETEVAEFIQSLCSAEIILHDRTVLDGRELDIYIPSRKLAIEFDGLYYHRAEAVGSKYHLSKTVACEAQGIQLIHIFSDEWEFNSDIVKSRLASKLGCSSRIFARRCEIVTVDTSATLREFLDSNHIQGYCVSSVNLGLKFNSELVAVMTFGNSRFSSGEFELLRYCSKLGTSVIGGAGKLLHKFHLSHPEIQTLVSYADRRWSSGNLYQSLGFTLDRISCPSYFYVSHDVRLSRMQFQKSKLIKKFGYSASLTEAEMAKSLGVYRIYDCGQYRFVKRF